MKKSIKRGRPRTAGVSSSTSFAHIVVQLRNYISLADDTALPPPLPSATPTTTTSPSSSSPSLDASMYISSYVSPNGKDDGRLLVVHDRYLSLWGTWTMDSLGLPTLIHRRRLSSDNTLNQHNVVALVCGLCHGQVHVVAVNEPNGTGSFQFHNSKLSAAPHVHIEVHRGQILAMTHHMQRNELITSGTDGQVKIWVLSCVGTGTLDDPHSTEKNFRARQRLTLYTKRYFKQEIAAGQSPEIYMVNALAVDDVQDLIVAGVGRDVFLWNVLSGDVVLRCPNLHKTSVRQLSFNAQTGLLVTSCSGSSSELCVWQLPPAISSSSVAMAVSVSATATSHVRTTALSTNALGLHDSEGARANGNSWRGLMVSFDSEGCLNVWKASHKRIRGVCSFSLPLDSSVQPYVPKASEQESEYFPAHADTSGLCHVVDPRTGAHQLVLAAGRRLFVFEVHWSTSAGTTGPTVIHPPVGRASSMEVVRCVTTSGSHVGDGIEKEREREDLHTKQHEKAPRSSLVVLTTRGLVGVCAPVVGETPSPLLLLNGASSAAPSSSKLSMRTSRHSVHLPTSRRILQPDALRPSSRGNQGGRGGRGSGEKSESRAISMSEHIVPVGLGTHQQLLAVGWTDGRVDIVNLETGERERMLLLPAEAGKTGGMSMAITSVSLLSGIGSRTDTTGIDSTSRPSSANNTSGSRRTRSMKNNNSAASSTFVVVGGASDGYLHLWSVGRHTHALTRSIPAHNAPIRSTLVLNLAATASRAASVRAAAKGATPEKLGALAKQVYDEYDRLSNGSYNNGSVHHCLATASSDGEIKIWEIIVGIDGNLIDIALRGYFTTTERPLTSLAIAGTLGDEATIVCGFGTGSLELWSAPFDAIDVAVARHSILEQGAHKGAVVHVSTHAPTSSLETRVGVDAETVGATLIGRRKVRSVHLLYDLLMISSSVDGSCLLWGVTSLGMTTEVSDKRPKGKMVVLRRLTFSGPIRSSVFFRGCVVVRVGALSMKMAWPNVPPEQMAANNTGQEVSKDGRSVGHGGLFASLMPTVSNRGAVEANSLLPTLVGLDSNKRDGIFQVQLVTDIEENEQNQERRLMVGQNSRQFARERQEGKQPPPPPSIRGINRNRSKKNSPTRRSPSQKSHSLSNDFSLVSAWGEELDEGVNGFQDSLSDSRYLDSSIFGDETLDDYMQNYQLPNQKSSRLEKNNARNWDGRGDEKRDEGEQKGEQKEGLGTKDNGASDTNHQLQQQEHLNDVITSNTTFDVDKIVDQEIQNFEQTTEKTKVAEAGGQRSPGIEFGVAAAAATSPNDPLQTKFKMSADAYVQEALVHEAAATREMHLQHTFHRPASASTTMGLLESYQQILTQQQDLNNNTHGSSPFAGTREHRQETTGGVRSRLVDPQHPSFQSQEMTPVIVAPPVRFTRSLAEDPNVVSKIQKQSNSDWSGVAKANQEKIKNNPRRPKILRRKSETPTEFLDPAHHYRIEKERKKKSPPRKRLDGRSGDGADGADGGTAVVVGDEQQQNETMSIPGEQTEHAATLKSKSSGGIGIVKEQKRGLGRSSSMPSMNNRRNPTNVVPTVVPMVRRLESPPNNNNAARRMGSPVSSLDPSFVKLDNPMSIEMEQPSTTFGPFDSTDENTKGHGFKKNGSLKNKSNTRNENNNAVTGARPWSPASSNNDPHRTRDELLFRNTYGNETLPEQRLKQERNIDLIKSKKKSSKRMQNKKRHMFAMDSSYGNGNAVPVGFSDARHEQSLRAKMREDDDFFEKTLVRKEEAEARRTKRQELAFVHSLNNRDNTRSNRSDLPRSLRKSRLPLKGNESSLAVRMAIHKSNLEERSGHNLTKQIGMNNFRDHTGAEVMLFGTAPPPPPGYTADWMSRHSSSRPGTASSARDSDAFSDSSRDNDDDRLMDQAFQMMEGAEEETFLVPEVGPEVDDSNLSARWSDPGMYSEERWNECYPATPWEDMEEDLKVAELRIAIWDTDVAAAALYSGQVGNQLPRPDYEQSIDPGEKKHWNLFRTWFANQNAIRAAMVGREVESSLMFLPVIDAIKQENIIDGELLDSLIAMIQENVPEKSDVISLLQPPLSHRNAPMMTGISATSDDFKMNRWYLETNQFDDRLDPNYVDPNTDQPMERVEMEGVTETETEGVKETEEANDPSSTQSRQQDRVDTLLPFSTSSSLRSTPQTNEMKRKAFVHIARSVLQEMEIKADERDMRHVRRDYVDWYISTPSARILFLEQRLRVLRKAVATLVRWGRNRALLALDVFGPVADRALEEDDAAVYISFQDMDEEEQEMEVMAALCDRTVRRVAEKEGMVLPPVDGIVDGSGIDTPDEIAFAHWWSGSKQEEEEALNNGKSESQAKSIRLDFLRREATLAMQSSAVVRRLRENEYVQADAKLTEVQVPQKLEEHEQLSTTNEAKQVIVRKEFDNWATSEEPVVDYSVAVQPIVRVQIVGIEQETGEEGEGEGGNAVTKGEPLAEPTAVPIAEPTAEPGTSTHATEKSNEEPAVVKANTVQSSQSPPQPPAVPSGKPTEGPLAIESRHRRGAPSGQRRAYGEFKSFYSNDRNGRRDFLKKRRALFHKARAQRAMSSVPEIVNELPDLFSDTLHMENFEDDEHHFKLQKEADEISWYMDKYEIKAWYSADALRYDDKLMKNAEFVEQKAARAIEIEARRHTTKHLIDNGMYNFGLSSGSDSETSIEDDEFMEIKQADEEEDNEQKEAERKLKKKNHRHELAKERLKQWEQTQDTWEPQFITKYEDDIDNVNLLRQYKGGSGLDNGDEAYFAEQARLEEERTFLIREQKREKKNLKEMRIEERDQKV